jgi:hypothetical protein
LVADFAKVMAMVAKSFVVERPTVAHGSGADAQEALASGPATNVTSYALTVAVAFP